jgi:WD40 repeat protein/serine/threonine protein kinase
VVPPPLPPAEETYALADAPPAAPPARKPTPAPAAPSSSAPARRFVKQAPGPKDSATLQVTPAPAPPGPRPPSTQRTAPPSTPRPTTPVSANAPSGVSLGTKPTEPPPAGAVHLPGYEILGELGRGGMGVVYKARQIGLNRLVALKMILTSGHASQEDLARFRLEAAAVARLQHPCIVQIYEIGEHTAMPYFSLEFCSGGTLGSKLDGTPLPPKPSAKLIQQIARAVQAAHDQGIIHRDLKPANVLLQPRSDATASTDDDELRSGSSSMSGSRSGNRSGSRSGSRSGDRTHTSSSSNLSGPGSNDSRLGFLDGSMTPKLTDFGLAKDLAADSGQTQSGAILGTPSYMSPEQADARSGQELGPRTDVWALGAILYEMVTGRPPFKGTTPMATVFQVLTQDPVPPTQLQHQIPRDLETIILKALQKDPQKRYPSAAAFAEDLGRFRDGEPIQARPAGVLERAIKWARRRPTTAALMGVVGLMIVGAVLAGVMFTVSLRRERDKAEEQKVAAQKARDDADVQRVNALTALEKAELTVYVNRVSLANREYQSIATEDPVFRSILLQRTFDTLELCRWDLRNWEWRFLARRWDLANAGSKLANPRAIEAHTGGISRIAFTKDGQRVATSSYDGTVKIWDAKSGQVLHRIVAAPRHALCCAFNPSGTRLAVGGGHQDTNTDRFVHVYDTSTGQKVLDLDDHGHVVFCVGYSPNGKWLVTGSFDHLVKVRDAETGKVLHELPGHVDGGLAVAFSPDNKVLATSSNQGTVMLWETKNFDRIDQLRGHVNRVTSIAYTPDGKLLATAGVDMRVKLWDAESHKLLRDLTGHTADVWSVAFTTDGNRLASASGDGSIIIWEPRSGQELLTLRAAKSWAFAVAFAPDGNTMMTGSGDQFLRVWEAQPDQGVMSLRHPSAVPCVAYHPEGKMIASGTYDSLIKLWDSNTGKEIDTLTAHTQSVTSIAFTPDGKRLVSATGDPTTPLEGLPGEIKVWDVESRKEVYTLVKPPGSTAKATDVDVVKQKLPYHDRGIFGLGISGDGQRFATAGSDGRVKIWELATGKLLQDIPVFIAFLGAAMNHDGTLVAAAGIDKAVHVWRVDTGEEQYNLVGHTQPTMGVAFSPDGKRLISTTADYGKGEIIKPGEMFEWDLTTGKKLREFGTAAKGHKLPIFRVVYSHNGQYVASVSGHARDRVVVGEVLVWDAQSAEIVRNYPGHRGLVFNASFARDGKRLATASYDQTVKVWDLTSAVNALAPR